MRHFLLLLAAPLLPLFLADTAKAAFDPAVVAADAQWVVHVDLNTLRGTVLGKELIGQIEKQMPPASETGELRIDFQKLLSTVGSATAYGTNFNNDPKKVDGALIARGTPDLRKITEGLLVQLSLMEPKKIKEVSDLGYDAYLIDNEVIIAFPPEPVIIVSKSKAQVQKARDVLRGSATSLAKSPNSALQALLGERPNAFIFAASVVPAEKIIPDDAPQARILKMANAGALSISEETGTTAARVRFVAASEKNADSLMKILNGLTAMLAMASSENRQVAEFLNSAKVARDNNTVTLDLAYSSAGLIKLANNLQQDRSGPRPQPIVMGKTIAEWKAADADPNAPSDGPLTRTIENVTLTNGCWVVFGRSLNGGRDSRFDRFEIASVDGGPAMIFKRELSQPVGSNMRQIQFPGADGRYNIKVGYTQDPDGKATYAVSVREPRIAPPPPPQKAEEKKAETKK